MRSIDLETFYNRIRGTIQTTTDYLQQPLFKKLVRSCRLKPYNCFENKGKCKKLEYWWVDDFGNSLYIQDQKFQCVLNDPNINFKITTKTDLFYGLGIETIMEQSKIVVCGCNHFIFYGKDEYFRCFSINNNIKVSSLECGIEELFWILENLDKKYAYKDQDLNWVLYQLPNSEIETIIRKDYIDNGQ